MHIENMTINLGRDSTMFRALLAALVEGPQGDGERPAASAGSATPPRIGEYWEAQGGIYCGIARGEDGQADHHLILAAAAPAASLSWQAAIDWAKAVTADGHNDFSLPTRFESALLYANVHDKLDATRWHWTCTQYSEDYAWDQGFSTGSQYYGSKKAEAWARAVRLIQLNP